MSTISSISRVSESQKSAALLAPLEADQASLLKLETEVSTGNRLTQTSDDPAASVGILNLNMQVAANTQYNSNLTFAGTALSTANNILTNALTTTGNVTSIAQTAVNSTTSADQRAGDAQVVDSAISTLLDMANAQTPQGQSVFGGQNTSTSPYVFVNGGYKYVGTTGEQSIVSPTGTALPFTVDGSTVFGGLSAPAGSGANLNPALTGTTRLVDLAGATGQGVKTGPINVTVGSTTVSVDLSTAANVNDVVSDINAALTAAGSDASVAISGGSLAITGDSAQSLTIANGGSSNLASQLGIATTVAAAGTFTGATLGAQVTSTTPLSSLNNGAGLDPSGFIITNGPTSATITLGGLTTVGDLINAINNSGTNVDASITADGTGIQIVNPVSGSPLTIGENGGTTAAQLGIRSLDANTALSSLNNSQGVSFASSTATAGTGNITINTIGGSSFNVQINGITTPSALVAAINSATGNSSVTAALNATGNGITLTDSSTGTGSLAVTAGPGYSAPGTNLGLIGTASAGGTLTGGSINFSTDDLRITRTDGTSFTVDLTGAGTIQDVLNKINSADGNSGPEHVTAALNTNGNGISLTDPTTGTGTLSVTALNNSSAASQLGILQTAGTSTPGTINGADVNPVEPEGLFSTLVNLRNALTNNNTAGISQAATLLAQDTTRMITANGIIGARQQDISTRTANVSAEQLQLQSSLSDLQDTDETSVITQYQSLQTAYQAALEVGQTTRNLSLLDFLS